MTETLVNTSKGTVRRLRHIARENGANGELLGRPGYPADEQIRRLELAYERLDIREERMRITDEYLRRINSVEERFTAARNALAEAVLVVRTRMEESQVKETVAEVADVVPGAANFVEFAKESGWTPVITREGEDVIVTATPQSADEDSSVEVSLKWQGGLCVGGFRVYADGTQRKNRNAAEAKKFVSGAI